MSLPYTILYLDDEVDNLTAFKAVFRRFFNVYTAENADSAQDILEQQSIDLIVCDQRMPGKTGVEFLEQVSTTHPDMIRMILTGYTDMQAIIDTINKGKVYHYITKPWKFEELKVIFDLNIETISAYMALTLNQMGILGNKTAAETQQILGQFIVAATAATGPTTAAATSDLQARLNSLVPQYGVSEFKLSEPQAKTIYNQILEGATIEVTDGSPLVIPGKQPHLDAILGNALAHDTLEYVALMSLFYNAESLVAAGSKLATAVINDDRAEAWYQIRYGSNADGQHTDRRIDESKLFSLYDNPGLGVSEAEAKVVLRMYTIHQKEIQDYEIRFASLFPTVHFKV